MRGGRGPGGGRQARDWSHEPEHRPQSAPEHRTVLLRGGDVHSPADPFATAMVVERGHVAWVGSEGAADAFASGVDEVVDLEGALVTPAFTDAHVHTTATGLALTGLDLSGARTLSEALGLVRAFANGRPAGDVLLGHGWDSARWPERRHPSRAELDGAAGGRALYLPRIDAHSAIVTTALLDLVPGVTAMTGYHPDAPLTGDAHHAVRAAAHGALPAAQRAAAQRAALDHAASLGIGSVHECGGPEISDEEDFTSLLALAAERPGPRVLGLWAEEIADEKDARRIRELGAIGAAGDLFVDGSLGSHTACLHRPYADDPRTGTAHLDASRIAAHVTACTEAGLQAGFHAIGDAAVTAVVDGIRAAAGTLGLDRIRAARHRVEHAEMLTPETIAAFAELGLTASVQPAFDAAWGGPEDVRRAPRRGAGRHPQPVRGAAARRSTAGLRLRQPGHPARPLGHRAGRRPPPHPGTPHLGPRRVHRAHPRRLAGRRPRRRGPPGARRPGRLRRLAHRRTPGPGP